VKDDGVEIVDVNLVLNFVFDRRMKII